MKLDPKLQGKHNLWVCMKICPKRWINFFAN
jgi:hypothetical protein